MRNSGNITSFFTTENQYLPGHCMLHHYKEQRNFKATVINKMDNVVNCKCMFYFLKL